MSGKTALIVIDMIKGFCEEGNTLYCGSTVKDIVPNIRRLIEHTIAQGGHLLFLADTHDPDDKEFQMFPPHCIAGSSETEVIPELAKYGGEVIPKNRYSGFWNTNLDKRLKEIGATKLRVAGVCTDICVMHTVADARNRDYDVEVYRDCVTSFDLEAHEWAIKHMESVLGAKIKTTDDL